MKKVSSIDGPLPVTPNPVTFYPTDATQLPKFKYDAYDTSHDAWYHMPNLPLVVSSGVFETLQFC